MPRQPPGDLSPITSDSIVSQYRNPAIKQLRDQQVRYAPRDVRLRQIENAERLVYELDPGASYRYRELCARITDYRPELYPALEVSGDEAIHDLRCFVEDLSASVDLPIEAAGEPVLTVEDVAERYNISAKTVNRWRSRGLVSRRFRVGSRRRIGFLQSSVERFVVRHGSEIERGSRFSQLTEDERLQILRRARRLARHGANAKEISRRLARTTGRAAETIRYTLRKYDLEHPESAVFPNASTRLSGAQKRELYRGFRRGIPVLRLARQSGRTPSSIYRILNEVRAQRLREQMIDFVPSAEFERPNADEIILGPPPAQDLKPSRTKPPPELPPYLSSLYAIPLLTREEEVYYFRRMNYLKFRATQLRDRLDRRRPRTGDMDAIEDCLERSIEVKNFLIRSNLRLVVSIAKRHLKPQSNFFEMVSDGNMSLIRAIEKFDYSKGNKFSTYATWAIMKNFARSIPAEFSQMDRFRTGTEDVFQQRTDIRTDQFQQELANRRQRQAIMGILDQLDERERDIITWRFGLSSGAEPQTLEQVGEKLGLSKERVRQLEARGLRKLRKVAREKTLEIPEIT